MSYGVEHEGVGRSEEDPHFEDLGRPVDAEWLSKFKRSTIEIGQGIFTDVRFRIAPGILYLSGKELETAYLEDRIPRDIRNTEQFVEDLVDRKILDVLLSRSVLRVPVDGLQLPPTRSNPNSHRIRARVWDVTRPSSYQGFVIRGEKYDIARDIDPFDFERQAPTSSESRHFITIGALNRPQRRLEEAAFARLQNALGRNIPVGPVGRLNVKLG